MTTLTPAVQDAAYRLGWALEAAGEGDPFDERIIDAVFAGARAFTPEVEAERVECAKAAHWAMAGTVERRSIIDGAARMENQAYWASRHPLSLDDTQGQVPDASMVAQWKDE